MSKEYDSYDDMLEEYDRLYNLPIKDLLDGNNAKELVWLRYVMNEYYKCKAFLLSELEQQTWCKNIQKERPHV